MPFSEDLLGRLSYTPKGSQSGFPVGEMPQALADSILETASDLDVPFALPAQAALAAWGLACQRVVDVQCGSFSAAPVGGFHLTLIQSSRGKSATVQRYMHPFTSTMEQQRTHFEDTQNDYRTALALWQEDRDILRKKYRAAEPESDEWRRLRVEFQRLEAGRPKAVEVQEKYYKHISAAGLREAFVANPSVGIVSPDAEPMFAGQLFRHTADLSGYWSGEGGMVGLAGGDRRMFKPRLMLALMIQNEPFTDFMKRQGDEAFDSGFLCRCLVANPIMEDVPGRPVQTGTGYLPKLSVVHKRISETLRLPMARADARSTLTLSKEAELRWTVARQWVSDNLICSADYSERVKRFFRRIGEHYARLAAEFHYFECPDDPVISVKAMTSAIELCEWYMWEYVRIFSEYSPSTKQINQISAERLWTWLNDAIENPARYPQLTLGQYTLRDLQQYSTVRNKVDLISAIHLLASQGVLTIGSGKRGGTVVWFPPVPCNRPGLRLPHGFPIQPLPIFHNR